MIEINDKSKCCGCEACANNCPKRCITMVEDEHGFRYPNADKNTCIECGLCEQVCPILVGKKNEFGPDVYAVQNKNDLIRKKSSSGGLFSVLASYVIEQDGVVYGAYMDSKQCVNHIEIEDKNGLDKIRGSKYLQSHINDSYKKIRQQLQEDMLVLFSGTGCQIAGLKSFLGKEYDNLITVEVVCHGVPSEKVFKKYINELEEKKGNKVKSINFRDKVEGWNNYNITITFDNGENISQKAMENEFMKGYIHNLYLRPSCKECQFKSMSSGSDILLGDFWGVNELGEPWNDNKGTSVVFVNSKKGKELIEKVNDGIVIESVEFGFATQFNPCIIKPVEISKDIYDELESLCLKDAVEKNVVKKEVKVNFSSKVKSKIRRILRG